MNIEVLNSGKDFIEIKTNNLTIAELLRVYLNNGGVKFAAWKREHPDKPLVMRIEVSNGSIKKAIGEAISSINKDLSEISKILKK